MSTPASSNSPRQVTLFDDGSTSLGPLSETRLAFEHRGGALTQLERVGALGVRVSGVAATPGSWALHRDRFLERWGSILTGARSTHAVHGLASPSQVRAVLALASGQQLVDPAGRLVGAALGGDRTLESLSEMGWTTSPGAGTVASAEAIPTHPWHLLDQLPARLAGDLELLASVPGTTVEQTSLGTVIRNGAVTVDPGVVLDARKGPIALWDGSHVGSNAVIQGPCVIGAGSAVSPRGLVKPQTVIGPTCRIGCEIGGSIVQGCSNAVHDGHIGDSIIGEWVNVGAGTCISNLLNTYGEVIASLGPDQTRCHTGRTHYGGLIGDHAKLAILVAIPTGFSIGVGAMVAVSRSPQTVGNFGWITPDRHSVNRLDRVLQTESAMMMRRQQSMGAAHRAFLEALHAGAARG